MSQGIILAGGFSSRAKSNKMHFIVDGKPILIHTIESLKPFVNKLIVVTGYYDSDIRLFVKEDDKIRIVYNKDFQRGMFSSVLTGVKEIKEDFFIIPGDIPFVSKETFEKLLKGSKPVRYPVYENKEGHPLFIAKELIKDLLNEPIDSNLKAFRDRQDKEAISVNDKNILKDIDTVEEFEKILKERK